VIEGTPLSIRFAGVAPGTPDYSPEVDLKPFRPFRPRIRQRQAPSGDEQSLVTFDNYERYSREPSFTGPRKGCALFREGLASCFATTARCQSGEHLFLPLDQQVKSLDLGRR